MPTKLNRERTREQDINRNLASDNLNLRCVTMLLVWLTKDVREVVGYRIASHN